MTGEATDKLPRFVPKGEPRFSLQRVDKPAAPFVVGSGRCLIGALEGNDLRISDDPRVSRFHCEVRLDRGRGQVTDTGSSNGTFVDGLQVTEAFLKDGSLIRLGPEATVRFRVLEERAELELSQAEQFGGLIGRSIAMRVCFAQLERMAKSDAPVLIEGETGTGKTAAVEALHAAAGLTDAPLVAIDCGALPEPDLELALFGRTDPKRPSAFEEATDGTLLLEEVSELSERLQARLLPVLEKNELRRPGSVVVTPVRMRVVSTTRGDLRAAVNAGRFKSELFYRLAVLRVQLPPLRERPDDVPMLVDLYLKSAGLSEPEAAKLRTPEFIERLQTPSWRGNVRELFNHLDRSVVMQAALAPHQSQKRVSANTADARMPYAEARRLALERFEEGYVLGLLRLFKGSVTEASKHAGIDRAYLHRLIKRHNL